MEGDPSSVASRAGLTHAAMRCAAERHKHNTLLLRLERGEAHVARRRTVSEVAAPYSVPMEPPGTKSPSCADAHAGPTQAARRASAARSTSVNTGAASYVCTLVLATQTSQSPAARGAGRARGRRPPRAGQACGEGGAFMPVCADTKSDRTPGHGNPARVGRRMGLGGCTRVRSC